MRLPVFATCGLGFALLAGIFGSGPALAEVSRQAGTPAPAPTAVAPAATPAPEPAAEPTAVAPDPAAPAVDATTDVVTLVTWYANDPSGEFINVVPIAVDAALVAGPQQGAAAIGRADFPDEGTPVITLGETRFDTYARSEGDIPERWTWLDDVEGARPATLVMQVSGSGGPYGGYYGTATFISRDEGGAGGVLVLALRPAAPAADAAEAEPAAEGEAPADAAPADETVATDAEAVQPDPDLPVPTDVLAEPAE